MGISFTSVATSWWGEACCLLLCFPTGTCFLCCTQWRFEFLTNWGGGGGGVTLRKPWWDGVTNFGWKPPLHNSRNFISQRSTSHATQSFITPGEPQFPQLFCPCMVQLLAGIISLKRVLEANPGRSHGSADTLPLGHSTKIMYAMASQITSLAIVYSAVLSGANHRKHQSSASLAFVRGIHRWPMNSPHKRLGTRKLFPFDDVIMTETNVRAVA